MDVFADEGLEEPGNQFEDAADDVGSEEDYVYLQEGDLQEIYEEGEVMEALATYKEIRGASNAQQKGRQYYRNPGGFGRGAPEKGAGKGKGKNRIHIEQLKLRTRCARCGSVGHWAVKHLARECRAAQPDQRGQENARRFAATSSASSVASRNTTATSATNKTWFCNLEPHVEGEGEKGSIRTSYCFLGGTVGRSDACQAEWKGHTQSLRVRGNFSQTGSAVWESGRNDFGDIVKEQSQEEESFVVSQLRPIME